MTRDTESCHITSAFSADGKGCGKADIWINPLHEMFILVGSHPPAHALCSRMRQSFNQRAVHPVSCLAFGGQIGESHLHGTEVFDLCLDVRQMRGGQRFHLSARTIVFVRQPQQGPDLVERKPKLPGSANEGKARNMGGAVDPGAASGTRRRW